MQEGDYLECVRTLGPLQRGTLYRSEGVFPLPRGVRCRACGQRKAQQAVSLNGREVEHPRKARFNVRGWCPCLFRPVYRRREDLLQLICEPVDGVRETETA